jgi:microcystin-dependent protein
MAEPFLGELRLASFNFPPKGWAFCSGALLPINQNQALFALLGTQFGGNGQTNFALPDLRGRTPIHSGAGFIVGQASGQETHTLTQAEMPQHLHFMQATTQNANTNVAHLPPPGNLLASVNNGYAPAASLVALAPAAITNVGGSQAHENRQPYLVLNWIIALQGIFPSPN